MELYVAGVLSVDENMEVEEYALHHPEIKSEINSIEKAFEKYALAHAKQPSKSVLNNVLSAIETQNGKVHKGEGRILQMKPAAAVSPFLKYLAYAAVALLFISGSLNIYYYNKFQNTQQQLVALQGENEYLANQFNTMQANYDELAGEMNFIKSPDNIAVTMKGSALQPDAIATIYWNKQSGDVHLNVNNLPVPPQGKQYQLWAIKDGERIDAGVFDMDGSIQIMKNIPAADAFAVTLEPVGGSKVPTIELIYVVGNV
ncbi:MAG: anti-sigma factor [Fimbriimonadaceae bacterium]|nr:anti-sigma factor [Chitinophagales bacterium]